MLAQKGNLGKLFLSDILNIENEKEENALESVQANALESVFSSKITYRMSEEKEEEREIMFEEITY